MFSRVHYIPLRAGECVVPLFDAMLHRCLLQRACPGLLKNTDIHQMHLAKRTDSSLSLTLVAESPEPADVTLTLAGRSALAVAARFLARRPLVASDFAVVATQAGRTAALVVAHALAAVHARNDAFRCRDGTQT